ncbi:MAG: zinc ribbon domain-containing protein [Planctomycetota bacterium]
MNQDSTTASQEPQLNPNVISAQLVEEVGGAALDLGTPCSACGAPREGSSKFCVACGSPLETRDIPVAAKGNTSVGSTAPLPKNHFECNNCGSQVATSVEQRSYVCPFCDSTYVREIAVASSGRQRPEFVIGFAITADDAREKFVEWLGANSWFRPGDLAASAVSEKQRGVYLPFWHFSMFAESKWRANIGEYWYRTETYTTRDSNGKLVTRTRRVRETEWFTLDGDFQKYYYGYLVPATRGISLKEAQAIQPYQLTALTRYRPFFLAGWMAEEYSIDMNSAIGLTQQEFQNRQQREIAAFLPGDTHRRLNVQTRFKTNGSDLILLPVHVLSYRYQDRVYRFLVNGQTGKVVGEKPVSKKRVTAFVSFIVVIIIAIIVAVVLLGEFY